MLDFDALTRHARSHKTRRGWFGLFVPEGEIEKLIRSTGRVAVPESVFKPRTERNLRELERVAELLVERAVDNFVIPHQRRAESAHLKAATLDKKHSNFPVSAGRNAYELDVPASRLAEVDRLLASKRDLFEFGSSNQFRGFIGISTSTTRSQYAAESRRVPPG